jgi:choline kinase
VPKPLLQIGSKHLVEHQLATLAEAGVGPVGMVLGYHADDIRDVVGMRAEFVYNGRWATTNSLASFLAAKDWIKDDLIVLNCDILYHPDILTRLLKAGPDAVAFDSSSGHGLEHMKVELDSSGHLVRMSKTLDPGYVHGENVGILYFEQSTARRLLSIAERLIDAGRTKDWLGTAVQELCREQPVQGVDMAGIPWVEIDFAFDLDRARKEVLPAIGGHVRKTWTRRLVYASAIAALSVGAYGMTTSPHGQPGGDEGTVMWEAVPLAGGTVVHLNKGPAQQTWWVVERGQSAEARIEGPSEVYVESRLILDRDTTASSPSLLELTLDGEVVDWIRSGADLSNSVRFDGRPVGKRDREMLHLGPGIHTLHVRLSTVLEERALIRIRQIETEFTDD